MKNIRFFVAAMFFFLGFSMIWMACEKDEVTPVTVAEELNVPAEVSAYISDREVETLYDAVDAMQKPNKGWKKHEIYFRMKGDVTYISEPKHTKYMQLAAKGWWDEFGPFEYIEKVMLKEQKKTDWIGRGVIKLVDYTDKRILPRQNILQFATGERIVLRRNTLEEPNYIIAFKSVRSDVVFRGGQGLFEGAFGKAYKIEHYRRGDNECEVLIYGYVWLRNETMDHVELPEPNHDTK